MREFFHKQEEANMAGVLIPENVMAVFYDAYSGSNGLAGITEDFEFDPAKIEKNRQKIHDMLARLPDHIKTGMFGGSLPDACFDRNGVQWTVEHARVWQLVQLGIAIGEVRVSPREIWSDLPGGMPNIKVTQQ